MKNISIIINAVLIAAVAFLFYKVYGGNNNAASEESVTETTDSAAAPMVNLSAKTLSDLPKDVAFAFINADTVFAKYEFALKTKSAGESRVENYKRNYQQKADAFQREYAEYVERAGKGEYSREQGEAIETGLAKKRDDLMAMEMNQQAVLDELDNATTAVNQKINEFLTRFNKEHGYHCILAYTLTGGGVLGINDSLDVTYQVIDGLNQEYKASKK